jgi:DNA-binding transcriptional LysR family regulator
MTRPIDFASVDLNLLYTFHAIVERGGVGAAARLLRRSQPAVTARMRQLESDLGVRLLERAGRGVRPTLIGRAVAAHVSGVVAQMGEILDGVHAASTEPVGTLRIGALPTLATYVLPSVVAELVREHARLRFEIVPGFLADHLERLARGELDAVVSVGDAPRTALDVHTVGRVRAMAVVPTAGRRRRLPPLAVNALREQPFIAYGRVGDSFFDHVSAFLEEHGIDRMTRVTAPHIATIKSLVLAGAGFSILPDYTIVEPTLQARAVHGLDLVQPVWVGARRRAARVPIVAEIVRRLRRRAGR